MSAPVICQPSRDTRLRWSRTGFPGATRARSAADLRAQSALRQRFPLHPEPLQWSCYREIPALSKKEIVERGHQAFFADYAKSSGAAEKRFEYESTGGTTQSPMTVIMEEGWWNAQTERAYRASPILREFAGARTASASSRPSAARATSVPTRIIRFRTAISTAWFISILSSDPFAFPESEWDRIVLELQATKPEVLEGEPVYLSLLARAAQEARCEVPSLRRSFSPTARRARSTAGGSPRCFRRRRSILYGSTEAGYLFVGEAFKDNSQVIDDNAFIELVPWRAGSAGRVPDLRDDARSRGDAAAALPHRRHRAAFPTGFRMLGREGGCISGPMGRWCRRPMSMRRCRMVSVLALQLVQTERAAGIFTTWPTRRRASDGGSGARRPAG
jgi:phenylacetate-CoA ligase